MTTPKLPLVICVDDDEAMLGTVVRCLKREQIEIRSTLSASQALSWISSASPGSSRLHSGRT